MNQDQDDPEVKHKTLITIGIVFSALLFIAIFITLGITGMRISNSEDSNNMAESIVEADTIVVDEDYMDPSNYYNRTAREIEMESDSLREVILNQCPDCYSQHALASHLETEADKCAKLISELNTSFGDTLLLPGVIAGRSVSKDFFRRTEREEVLFSSLFAFREISEELAENAAVYDPISYREYFPLREPSKMYECIQTWSEEQYEQDPLDVMNFLTYLELDLRYYENRILWDMTY